MKLVKSTGRVLPCRAHLSVSHPKDTSETPLWEEMLKHAKKSLRDDEILVVDAGVKIGDLQEAGIQRYEVHLATNELRIDAAGITKIG